MASRALAFADPEVIRLASTAFVPVADDCGPLQRQQDTEGDFFRLVAEQGHYGGVTIPSDSRQGQYACTPDGRLLGSVNCHDAPTMLGMMRAALARWGALQASGAPPAPTAVETAPPVPDPVYARRPPEGGLILRAFTRDLPRGANAAPSRRPLLAQAVNHNAVWFTATEAAALVPNPPRLHAAQPVPAPLARRIARYHMIDVVRGGTPVWRQGQVRHATMTTTVADVTDSRVRLRLEGRFRCEETGTWAVRPFGPHLEGQSRGYDAHLLGTATWDRTVQRFTAFEALAVGERWGGSEHNQRWDDLDHAPMAVLFDLADGTAPGDAIPPDGFSGDYFGP